MSYSKVGRILGKIMILEGILMFLPLIVCVFYAESFINYIAFLVPSIVLIVLGSIIQMLRKSNEGLYQKEGFALVALVWIIMTLFGAIPFVINGDIPNYIDACFEIMSGFTTTGASIIVDITSVCHSTLFWRSFSHWIGGMGILVFVLIFIPESNEGSSMHLLRAESPGPQVGKIVSKMKVTTRILYSIYLVLSVLQVIILMCDKPIEGYENEKFFFSLLTTFGSAGTGGFSFIPNSMQLYSPFSQYVIAVFLILYGCNFSLYYLILIGKAKEAVKSEELRVYLGIIAFSVLSIFITLVVNVGLLAVNYTTEEAFRHSLFQVVSLVTTTGYTTTDYVAWPMYGQMMLLILTFFGAMAGSTCGGIKISRVVIAFKGIVVSVRKLINPRYVPKAHFEGKTLDEKTQNDVFAFFTMYIFILFIVTLLLALDPVNGSTVTITSDAGTYSVTHGFFSSFTSTLSCLSNIGPGFEAVGPYSSFAAYSGFSKILLTLSMLFGRLEILPVMILFSPKTWKKM